MARASWSSWCVPNTSSAAVTRRRRLASRSAGVSPNQAGPVRQAGRFTQHPQQSCRVAVGPVDGHRRTGFAVDPVALEPDQPARAEVDDVAGELHAVAAHVQRRHVHGTERLAELPARPGRAERSAGTRIADWRRPCASSPPAPSSDVTSPISPVRSTASRHRTALVVSELVAGVAQPRAEQRIALRRRAGRTPARRR